MHDTTDNAADANVNTASSWARTGEFNGIQPNAASSWAALSPRGTDSEVEDVACAVPQTDVVLPSPQQLEQHVEAICGTTTIADMETIIRNLNTHLKDADTVNEMAWVGNQYDKLLSKIALNGSHDKFLESHLGDDGIRTFAREQLTSTNASNPKRIESHVAETQRLGSSRKAITKARSLGATAAIALQRGFADVFLDNMCTKVERHNGSCETYFEKHRGEEPPLPKLLPKTTFGMIATKSLKVSRPT